MRWVIRWGYEMSATAVTEGIYRLKAGGYYGRGRYTAPSGRRVSVDRVMRDAKTGREAAQRLAVAVAEEAAKASGETSAGQLWSDFAVSRLEERKRKGKVKSEATIERWAEAIPIFCDAWGTVDVRDFTRRHIDRWLDTTVAKWMSVGRTVTKKRRIGDGSRRTRELAEVPITTVLKPSYVNGWLRVLRSICNAIKVKFDLPKSAFEGIEFFAEGRHFTKEKPNSLPPNRVPQFMALAWEKYPQHYAMIFLGMVTGLRPSSLRPLRRKGPEADLDWTTGELLVRRSHSRKQKIMDKTKTGKDGSITLPAAMIAILRSHVERLTGKQLESDLLFPAADGRLRTRGVLVKPFAVIAKAMGITYPLTPKAMRRSFQDIAREANLHDAVTRSISGHHTPEMQIHYSTARGDEQRAALEKTHALIAGEPKP